MYQEIPNYNTFQFKEKCFDYCVVIPVINENGRIIEQLKKMVNYGIDCIADIIIADGDSTDGSTAHDLLCSHNVNTLLVKKDIGRLSAQLRIAYNYALKRGYKGIVTIDGNNKDSVESIHDFIDLLKKGYDFVQGSRYLKGGKEINTPKIRNFANKYIHVPIINYLSGYTYTDTTNGFKAYSSKYLNSPLVEPLRDIFTDYDLLYYLTVKAPHLGFNVREIPVTRSYPSSGTLPTKLSLFQGSYLMLKPLFLLAIGCYDLNHNNKINKII